MKHTITFVKTDTGQNVRKVESKDEHSLCPQATPPWSTQQRRPGSRCETHLFAPVSTKKKRSFYQDRLGTNIRKALKRRCPVLFCFAGGRSLQRGAGSSDRGGGVPRLNPAPRAGAVSPAGPERCLWWQGEGQRPEQLPAGHKTGRHLVDAGAALCDSKRSDHYAKHNRAGSINGRLLLGSNVLGDSQPLIHAAEQNKNGTGADKGGEDAAAFSSCAEDR